MELYHQILGTYYAEHGFPEQMLDGAAVVKDACYQTVCRIRAVLADETLDDPACFYKIEAIVCALEDLGLDAGGRHDFG